MTTSRHFVIMDKEVREAVVKEARDLWHTQQSPSIITPEHKPMVTCINSDLIKVRELIETRLNQLNYDSTDEAMNDKTIGAYLELLEFMDDLKQNH